MSRRDASSPRAPELVTIRRGTVADAEAIEDLYRTVAGLSGGLSREAGEVTREYVEACVASSLRDGVLLVAERIDREGLAGELHAWRSGLRRFAHVLGHLTVAVHPDTQGQGIGRRLFGALLDHVRLERPEILRVELVTQESNARALALYESLGFRREGRLEAGILSAAGLPEDDIPMAWLRSRS